MLIQIEPFILHPARKLSAEFLVDVATASLDQNIEFVFSVFLQDRFKTLETRWFEGAIHGGAVRGVFFAIEFKGWTTNATWIGGDNGAFGGDED
jgi:hypothetical protein